MDLYRWIYTVGYRTAAPAPGPAAARDGAALPDRRGQRQAVQQGLIERSRWSQADALVQDVQLVQVLGGVPGRALEELVGALGPVIALDDPVELAVRRALEPASEPSPHERTVTGESLTVGKIGWRPLPEPGLG